MKVNNTLPKSFLSKINQLILSENLLAKLSIIYTCSFVVFFLIFLFGPSPTAGDTYTNLSAGSVIATGKLDALRTPIYPIFLHFFQSLFSNKLVFQLVIIAFQYLLFCISAFCFHSVVDYFVSSKKLAFFMVFFYACHPAIVVWQKIMLT